MNKTCDRCRDRGAIMITYGVDGNRGTLVPCDHCDTPPDEEAQQILEEQKEQKND